MRSSRIVHVVTCHTEGEVGDVIVGGVAPPPGVTVWDQSRWIAQDRTLRDFVLNEPRGGAVAIRPGKIDRSPTGTGCSARMAVLHAKGRMQVGGRFVGRSILGTEFHCRIDEALDLNGTLAIRPVVSGRAWVVGTQQLMLDSADPFPGGYRQSDTWPVEP